MQLEAGCGLDGQLHRRIGSSPRDVVGHAHRDLEHITRRHHQRQVGRDDEVTAHQGLRLGHAGRAVVHRHGHDTQGAVEVVRHGVAELAFAVQIHDARPVNRRCFAASLEGVQEARVRAGFVAPGRRGSHQAFELRQDQIQDLRAAHFQRALLEEVAQRIGVLVARHLQDAFVHRKHHGACGPVAGQLELHHLAGLAERRCAELQRLRALRQAGGKGHHAVAQRAHEDLVRARVADELHIDVAVAFKVLGQADLLHRSGGAGFEPGLRVDLVALDGDQARADVGRADADFDLFTRRVVLLVERELQFGIAFQRARYIALAGHAVVDAVELHARRVAQHVAEVARRARVQRQRIARGGHGQRLFGQHGFLLARLVLVGVVGLAHQHRDHLALHALQRQPLGGAALGLRVDGDDLAHTLAAARNKAQVAVVLDAHEEGQLRHQHAGFGRHVAAALGFKHLGQQAQAVGGAGVARQVQVEARFTLHIGLAFGQVLVEAFLGALRVVELVVGMGAKGRVGGAQRQRHFHAPVLGWRAKKVLRVDAAFQVLGVHPTVAQRCCRHIARGDELRRHLHAVGHELLHLDRGAADLAQHLVAFEDVEIDGVVAGGRCFLRGVAQLQEATRTDAHTFALDGQAAGVQHFRLQRNAGQGPRPVGVLDDHADVHRLAGAVDATVREEIGAELILRTCVLQPAHVKARIVDLPVAAVQRQKAHVAGLACQQQQGRAFAHQAFELVEVHTARRIGGLAEQRAAVLGHHVHRRAGHRLAADDGLHEHIARTVGGLLGQQAQVRHQHEAPFFLGRGVDAFALALTFTLGVLRLLFARFGLRRCIGVGLGLLAHRGGFSLRVVALHLQ